MLHLIQFCKKYKTELSVIIVLLAIPVIEPIFEVLVDVLFTTGQAVGTWVRSVSNSLLCK